MQERVLTTATMVGLCMWMQLQVWSKLLIKSLWEQARLWLFGAGWTMDLGFGSSDNQRIWQQQKYLYGWGLYKWLCHQITNQAFSGVGAQHQNAIVKHAIQTISYWACTIMVHTAIHWPSDGDDEIWLCSFVIKHAVWLYNWLLNAHENKIRPLWFTPCLRLGLSSVCAGSKSSGMQVDSKMESMILAGINFGLFWQLLVTCQKNEAPNN